MAALLCPSPVLLDHSFPRDIEELRLVSVSLGELIELYEKNEAHLLLTQSFSDFLDEFDWKPPRDFALLNEIHRLLRQLFLQQSVGVIIFDSSSVCGHSPHPVPQGCQDAGLIEIWADEVGRIYYLHNKCCKEREFFIGIACAYAFAGQDMMLYCDEINECAFPIVGPDNIDDLSDAYEWDVPPNIHLRKISFAEAKKNLTVLGAISVENPNGGSHYKVNFAGGRPWVLDPNNDPIPESYLRQLEDITSYPLLVIKTALSSGELPPRSLKLSKVIDSLEKRNSEVAEENNDG